MMSQINYQMTPRSEASMLTLIYEIPIISMSTDSREKNKTYRSCLGLFLYHNEHNLRPKYYEISRGPKEDNLSLPRQNGKQFSQGDTGSFGTLRGDQAQGQ